jgi:DNA-binding transcriptional LysR family regulator
MKRDFKIAKEDLDGIPAFLRVAERRSFSAAAAELGVSPSALSQSIRALEARVGTALFYRTTRSVGLTEAGERFLERVKPAMDGMREALQAARALGERPSGLLRINASRGVIASLISPFLPDFLAENPEIEVEVFASSKQASTSASGSANRCRPTWWRYG